MTKTEKKKSTMTNRAAMEWILDNLPPNTPDDVLEKLQKICSTYSKKSSGSKKQTERQKENEVIAAAVYEHMAKQAGVKKLASEWAKEIPEIRHNDDTGMNANRANAILKKLIEAGQVERVKEKGRSYFTAIA